MSAEDNSEATEKNMSVAVRNVMLVPEASGRGPKRSFDYSRENDFEYPTAKKVITEDDMSHYLGRLRLASQEATNGPGPYGSQPTLEATTYESDTQSLQLMPPQEAVHEEGVYSVLASRREEQEPTGTTLTKRSSPRKRSLDRDEEDNMECEYDCGCTGSDAVSKSDAVLKLCKYSGKLKRFRLDGVSSLPMFDETGKLQIPLNSSTSRVSHGLRSSPTLVPPCNIRCSANNTVREEDSNTASASAEEEEEEEEAVVGGAVGSNPPIRLWIAPEVQSLCADQKPLLPTAMMSKIKSRGMELVPYVGLPNLLLPSTGNDDARKKTQDTDTTASMDL